jgi:hypothetical protein
VKSAEEIRYVVPRERGELMPVHAERREMLVDLYRTALSCLASRPRLFDSANTGFCVTGIAGCALAPSA